MKYLIALAATVIIMWLYQTVKALKDPDVHIASDLRMSIKRYHKYKEAFDKIQLIYQQRGFNSPSADKEIYKIISQLPNLNEWRRYSAWRCEEDSVSNYYKNHIDDET